ncbi:ATPase-activating ribosome biosynthesis protein [Marasmius crinis-equi]|uniref:ATPase-activating ribosome biosynthesis protein n=1 Tax=Marasmius crinis-equi TaxID=585013 RepID=A0ABR3F5W8_9AGAR
MKRVGEIKRKREHAFWKNRMAASREKQRAHRKKTLEAAKSSSTKLVQPMDTSMAEPSKVKEKIKVPTKSRSALIQGEGRSMTMDVD